MAEASLAKVAVHRARRALLGLIGAPIASSAAPAMHEAAGDAIGVRCHYQLIEVFGADRAKLASLFDSIRRLGFAGVNVTYPYKEAAIPLQDELAPAAQAIGAVNTVVVCDGRLVGYNTDSTGFRRAARPLVEQSGRGPVALIGAGGVGKAIAFALAELAIADLRVFDADPAKTANLVARLAGRVRVTHCATAAEALVDAVGVVNATPVGMTPDRGAPVAAGLLRADQFVADAVYSPLWTPLLVAARAVGARTMTGRDLAIHQAADAFELFTGARPPDDVLGGAFDAVMAARNGDTASPQAGRSEEGGRIK